MKIHTKNWTASIDKMPGGGNGCGPQFRLNGTVVYSHSGGTAVLELIPGNDDATTLSFNLLTEVKGDAHLQVITESAVSYSKPTLVDITKVIIFHDGKEVAHIDDVRVTH
jgi:hypothetical protein